MKKDKPQIKYIEPMPDELKQAMYNATHTDSFLQIKRMTLNDMVAFGVGVVKIDNTGLQYVDPISLPEPEAD